MESWWQGWVAADSGHDKHKQSEGRGVYHGPAPRASLLCELWERREDGGLGAEMVKHGAETSPKCRRKNSSGCRGAVSTWAQTGTVSCILTRISPPS